MIHPPPRNSSQVRRPRWTGQPGEVAVLVTRGEPRRDDGQVEAAVRGQVQDYLATHTDRQLDGGQLAAVVYLIVKDHVWPVGAQRVLLDREHLLAYVDTALARLAEAAQRLAGGQ